MYKERSVFHGSVTQFRSIQVAVMKSSTLLLIFLTVVATCSAGASAKKRKKVPLTTVGRKTFYTVEGVDYVNWEEAKALCPTVGLVMSVVENEAESDALSALSYERLTKGKEQFIWLGAYLRREDEKWVWEANGEELTFTKWLDGTELQYTSSSAKEPSVNCGYLKASPGWDTWACGPGTGYEFALTVCQEP